MKLNAYPSSLLLLLFSFMLFASNSVYAQQNESEDWTWLDAMETRDKEWKRIERHYPVEETYWVHSAYSQYKVYNGNYAFQDGLLRGVRQRRVENLCGTRINIRNFPSWEGDLRNNLIAFLLSRDFNENKYEVKNKENANVLNLIRKKLYISVSNKARTQGSGYYKGARREEQSSYSDEKRAQQYIDQLLQDHADDDNRVHIERISGTKFRVLFSTVEAELTFTASKDKDVKYDIRLLGYIDKAETVVAVEEETCADASDYRAKYPDEEEAVDNAVVETQAQYPGGEAALLKFLAANLVYPQAAKENGIEGVVTLKFKVGKDGSVGEVRIVKGLSKDCEAAAVAVVKKLSRFTPATQRGEPVPVWFTLPIRFRLQ